MEHHVYNAKGDLKGINTIDVEKAKELYGYWEGIDAIVQAYTWIHPKEIRQTILENRAVRENNYDDFGSGKSKGFRHSVSIPHGLLFTLEQYDEELFTDRKKLNEFMKLYKGFRTCEKV